MKWNGVGWQVLNSPNIGTYGELYGVTAIPSTLAFGRNVWAVGKVIYSGTPNVGDVLIEHYNPSIMLACSSA
jgi:hypothetical protein